MKRRFFQVLCLLITVLLVSCEGTPSSVEPGESAEITSAGPACTAEPILKVEGGLLPAVVVRGEGSAARGILERMQELNVPGASVAVIDGFQIEWAKGYGKAEAGTDVDVTAETLFQAASISKPVAAVAALKLVEEEKLGLDEDVNARLTSWKLPENEFSKEKKVTLRLLLSHGAGVTVHGFPGYAAGKDLPTLIQILDGEGPANTAPIRVDKQPGTEWRYSGGGYTIVQQLIIDVTGRPFPDFLQEAVLEPLGMTGSTFLQPLPSELAGGASAAHRVSGKPIPGKWHTYPEMAAAGLWTTPSDLARFAIEIMKSQTGESNKVLSKMMTEQMLTAQSESYGLGLSLRGEGEWISFSHGGSNEGFRCFLIAYPKKGQGAVVMTNADNGGDLMLEILRGIAAAYGWPDFLPKEIEVVEVDQETLEKYVGFYRIEGQMGFSVSLENGGIVAVTPQGKFELRPISRTRFVSMSDGTEAEVILDDKGGVRGIEIPFAGKRVLAEKIR
jgi:CubicO group peptidase (beta-lactamase class C family)